MVGEEESSMKLDSKDISVLDQLFQLNYLTLKNKYNSDNNTETINLKLFHSDDQTLSNSETKNAEEPPENHSNTDMKDDCLCIGFFTKMGQKIFKNAIDDVYMNTYVTLAPHFNTQWETNLCGASTLTMTLNALTVDPHREWEYPWRCYNEYMSNSCVPVEVVMEKGIGFSEFCCTMMGNKMEVEAVRVSNQSSLKEFRRDIKRATSSFDTVLLVNFAEKNSDQINTGVYVPIGGYNKLWDMVLIIDTGRLKRPPHWVKLSKLWTDMREAPVEHSRNRDDMACGYFLVKKNDQKPTLTVKLPGNYRLKIDPFTKSEKVKSLENLFNQWNNFLDADDAEGVILQNTMEKLFAMRGVEKAKKSVKEMKKFSETIAAVFPIKKLHSTEIFSKIHKTLNIVCPSNIDSLLALFIDTWNIFDAADVKLTRRKSFVGKKVTQVPDGITTASYVITAFLIFWPYRASEVENNRMQLQKYVADDLSLFTEESDSVINEQLHFLLKTFEHVSHVKLHNTDEQVCV